MTTHARSDVIGQAPTTAPAEPAFVELQVAPSRRAFLVRRGDRAQLLAALTGAAAIWGGTRCPILPVEHDGAVREEWIRLAQVVDPSLIVDFTAADGGPGWAAASLSRWPVTPAPPLDDGTFWGPHPVAVIAPEELKTLSVILPRGGPCSTPRAPGTGCPAKPPGGGRRRRP